MNDGDFRNHIKGICEAHEAILMRLICLCLEDEEAIDSFRRELSDELEMDPNEYDGHFYRAFRERITWFINGLNG